MSDEPPLTVAKAAAFATCHSKTVLRALRRGELLGYQRGANCSWRIYPDDLDRWIRGEQPKRTRRAA
jgi:excisionase family DNA binding protein